MDTSLNIQPATPETVWAILREIGEKHADLAEKQAETDRQMKETDRKIANLAESQAETNRIMQETGRKLDKVGDLLGGISNNQGRFAEEYFFNSFEKGQRNFFGEKFDDIQKNMRGTKIKDEYDLVMLNGQSVGIVEIKYKAHENDVPKVLGKVSTFRANFTEYKNHTIYIGLATMAFYTELEQACQKHGIAIIKQSGDTVVINDEHLKAY